MRSADVLIGAAYYARVSGQVVPVRVTETHPAGGWSAVNQRSKRTVHIRSPRRLRGPALSLPDPRFERTPSQAMCQGTAFDALGRLTGCDARTALIELAAPPVGWCAQCAAKRQHALIREAQS